MKQSAKLVLLALVLWGAHLAKAQQEEGDVGSTDTTEFEEQNGINQTSGGNRAGRLVGVAATSANKAYSVLMTIFGDVTIQTAGAIISNTEILTSASSLKKAGTIKSMSIAAGIGSSTYQSTSYNFKSYQLHSDFDSATLANDVATITIQGTFAGLPNVQPIAVATKEIVVSTTNRTKCVVIGRGQFPYGSLNFLQSQADYELLTDQECATEFKQSLPSSMLCARSVSGYACNVDSGAPLVCNGQLYGILTEILGCTPSNTPKIQKFAKLPVITGPWYVPPPRKNYVSCP